MCYLFPVVSTMTYYIHGFTMSTALITKFIPIQDAVSCLSQG